ncbi:MAG: HEAT repeat domain-containing protein [Planctomycetes bacterium]|nr:HEAT repeat domain-containing protein [Planctomycetota bacterium]
MTPARFLLAAFFVLILGMGSGPLRAQPASPQEVEEWWEDLLLEGGDESNRAAFELFYRQVEPARLLRVMGGKNKKARVGILAALKMTGRTHPKTAFRLAEAALGDADPELHKMATRAIGLLETAYTYDEIGRELFRLRDARSESREGKVALALVDAIGRLRRPMRATGVLVGALSHRMSPTLEQGIRQVLERLTAHTFATPAKWRLWWESVLKRDLEPSEWRVQVVKRRTEAVRQLRTVALDYYSRTLTAYQDKPQALLKELARGLSEERIPGLPTRAILELGKLGRLQPGATPEQQAVRAEAVRILVVRLRKSGGAEFDPLKANLLRALGRTGDKGVLADLTRFLSHDSPKMRIAAVGGLADLRATEAIGDLLRQIHPDQDGQLILAALDALGQIGEDAVITPGPPPFRVSDRLTQFCEGVLAANGDAGPAAPSHLAAAAWSLGALRRIGVPNPKEIDLLGRLAAHPDENVRFKAIGALGSLPGEGAFLLLESRLKAEPAVHVRKAILNAIGRQALTDAKVTERAVAQLVPYLFEAREELSALRQAASDRLIQVAQGDLELIGLSAILTGIEQDRDPKAARQASLPFLSLLPTRERAKALSGPARERYLTLLTKRALAHLEADPQRALGELEEVLTGRGWLIVGKLTKESFPVFFGRARALLLADPKRPKKAFEIAEACLKYEANQGTWTLTLDAVEAMPEDESKAKTALLDRLAAAIEKAPDSVKERYARIRRELNSKTVSPTPKPPGPKKPGQTKPKTPNRTATGAGS